MNISLAVVAYNEGSVLNGLFCDILAQDYPHEKLELLLIDSASTDETKKIMEHFLLENKAEFLNIQVLENRKHIQAAGWNIAIQNYTSEALLRVDAHASIPYDFVSKNVRNLESGEMVSGGYRPNISAKDTNWSCVLLEAESSMFGSSIASYRRNNENLNHKRYVKSFFHGAYRREVLEKVGEFDEMLGRTEDNEFHYRIRKNSYRLCFDPSIVSYQHTRTTLWKMCRQKFSNGFWIGVTLGVCPKCLSLFHFVPVCFFIGIVFTTMFTCMGNPVLLYTMWIVYWLLAVLMAVKAVQSNKKCLLQLMLPIIFFLLHISYGIGTFLGLLYLPFFRRKHLAANKSKEDKCK